MDFELQKEDLNSNARAGLITTAHGTIETPIFMPVGTVGSVKAVHFHELENDIKAQIILGNTYHLYLRPGMDIIEKAGGLHKFNGWKRPILTDSGGFQVFSLSANRKLKEEGAYFRSHIDGSKHLFTPEGVVDIQRSIGSDIMMALDECPPGDSDYQYAKKSLALTLRWLRRGWDHYKATDGKYGYCQAYFPIVQGCVYKDLRQESAKFVADLGADGNAIGGLAVGESHEEMYRILDAVVPHLPEDKPTYLMGVGTPANILEAVDRGVDFFDCVYPSRNGRHSHVYTNHGKLNLLNSKYELDPRPIEEGCQCPACRHYSRAYIRHLLKAKEMLGMRLCVLHNLYFYNNMMTEIRTALDEGNFASYKRAKLAGFEEYDKK